MAKPLVTDALWDRVEPLLPPEPPKPDGGRPRVPDRAALTGILFVLRTGIQWRMLPLEMGCAMGGTMSSNGCSSAASGTLAALNSTASGMPWRSTRM